MVERQSNTVALRVSAPVIDERVALTILYDTTALLIESMHSAEPRRWILRRRR
jgi:hypothetical protein